MAKLIPPAQDTVMVQYGDFWGKHKWHFSVKTEGKSFSARAVCGAVCIDPVYRVLSDIRAKDLCKKCWPFEVEE